MWDIFLGYQNDRWVQKCRCPGMLEVVLHNEEVSCLLWWYVPVEGHGRREAGGAVFLSLLACDGRGASPRAPGHGRLVTITNHLSTVLWDLFCSMTEMPPAPLCLDTSHFQIIPSFWTLCVAIVGNVSIKTMEPKRQSSSLTPTLWVLGARVGRESQAAIRKLLSA